VISTTLRMICSPKPPLPPPPLMQQHPKLKTPIFPTQVCSRKKKGPSVYEAKKLAAVNDQFRFWLTRPGDESLGDPPITMLQFWKAQPDCMLRRVALRIGAFMLSQCATERINKIPKEVWTADRMNVSEASMARNFLYHNTSLDRFPLPLYEWVAQLKKSGEVASAAASVVASASAMVLDED